MPRKRKRRRPAVTAPEPSGWQWRTFPVFFAFVVGVLLGIVLAFSLIGPIVFYVALFAVVFGAVHMLTRQFVQRRQRARGQEVPGRGVPTEKRMS